jgi:hypothetical protein
MLEETGDSTHLSSGWLNPTSKLQGGPHGFIVIQAAVREVQGEVDFNPLHWDGVKPQNLNHTLKDLYREGRKERERKI